jgi:hypothetical protein
MRRTNALEQDLPMRDSRDLTKEANLIGTLLPTPGSLRLEHRELELVRGVLRLQLCSILAHLALHIRKRRAPAIILRHVVRRARHIALLAPPLDNTTTDNLTTTDDDVSAGPRRPA